eukprot:1259995-Pyramimonas_sp.AAC.1
MEGEGIHEGETQNRRLYCSIVDTYLGPPLPALPSSPRPLPPQSYYYHPRPPTPSTAFSSS